MDSPLLGAPPASRPGPSAARKHRLRCSSGSVRPRSRGVIYSGVEESGSLARLITSSTPVQIRAPAPIHRVVRCPFMCRVEESGYLAGFMALSTSVQIRSPAILDPRDLGRTEPGSMVVLDPRDLGRTEPGSMAVLDPRDLGRTEPGSIASDASSLRSDRVGFGHSGGKWCPLKGAREPGGWALMLVLGFVRDC